MEGGVNGFLGMIVLNYSDWKIKMEDLVMVKDLYDPIERKKYPQGYYNLNGKS